MFTSKTAAAVGILAVICVVSLGFIVWSSVCSLNSFSHTYSVAADLKIYVKVFQSRNGRLPVSFKELMADDKDSSVEDSWERRIVYDHAIDSPTCFLFWHAIDPNSDVLFVSSVPVRSGIWNPYSRVVVKEDGSLHVIPEREFTEMVKRSVLSK